MTKKYASYHLVLCLGIIIFFTFSTVQAGNHIQSSIPGYDCYRDSESIVQSLEVLENEYPDLVQLSIIGNSWENQPIYALTLTNQSEIEPKPRLVLVSGLRANAFAPVELSMRFAEELLADYGTNSDNSWLLDQYEIHMIFVANPDGRARAETQAQNGENITWQNNTNNTCLSQENGVRLNHNFPFAWRESLAGSCDPAYSGESAGSEPETQAVIAYLQDLNVQPAPIMLLQLDSYQNNLISPYLSDPIAENPHIEDLYWLADKIGFNTLSRPIRQDDILNSPSYGTLIDYAFGTLGIPSLVFSMGEASAGGYSSYCWYFEDYLLDQNIAALIRGLKVSADPFHQSYGPEIQSVNVNQDIHNVEIEGSANDFERWYGGADEYSQVKSIFYSIDLPPWHDQAVLHPILNLVQDEDYDYISHFSLDLDYSNFSPGRYRIFLQAWDTEANENPSNPGLVESIDILIPYRQFIPFIGK